MFLKTRPSISILILTVLAFIYFQTGKVVFAQNQNEPVQLSLGSVIDARLSVGEKHSYKIKGNAGDFLKVKVEQQGIDVILRLYSPIGTPLIEIDTPNGTEGIEKIVWMFEKAGNYWLEVKALDPDAAPGNYRLQVQELHPATDLDKKLIENQRLFQYDTGETKDLIGRAAPKISLLDIAGKTRDLTEFSGKVIVLNFWATWCVPCRAEMPIFEKLRKRFSEDEVVFFGINDEDRDTAAAFLKQQNLTMPVLFDEWLEANLKYKINYVPTTVIIDRAGKVRRVFIGLNTEEKFYQVISALKAKR
jgi:peroxiredoxin